MYLWSADVTEAFIVLLHACMLPRIFIAYYMSYYVVYALNGPNKATTERSMST